MKSCKVICFTRFFLGFIFLFFKKILYLQCFRNSYFFYVKNVKNRMAEILCFVPICIEQNKMHTGMSGSEMLKLFDNNDVNYYLAVFLNISHCGGVRSLKKGRV